MSYIPKRLITVVNAIPFATRFYWRVHRNQPVGASVNVSGRCPVGCSCYWRIGLAKEFDIQTTDIGAVNRAGKKLEMSDEALIEFLEHLRDEGCMMVMLVGGEPYVRRELLPKLGGILPWTWIATSGTTPFIRMKRTTHFVSIDGANAQTHDTVRQSAGLFDRIIKNLRTIRSEGNFPTHIHMVLNRLNYLELEQVVERFCLQEDLADTVAYSTYTAMNGRQDEHLYLSDSCRRQAVDMLYQVQEKYPEWVSLSKPMIRHLEGDALHAQTATTCSTSRFVRSYREDGQAISQCIFGPDANCSECGCVITAMLDSLLGLKDFQSARVLARLIPLCE